MIRPRNHENVIDRVLFIKHCLNPVYCLVHPLSLQDTLFFLFSSHILPPIPPVSSPHDKHTYICNILKHLHLQVFKTFVHSYFHNAVTESFLVTFSLFVYSVFF